jgi:hypothetical protein
MIKSSSSHATIGIQQRLPAAILPIVQDATKKPV